MVAEVVLDVDGRAVPARPGESIAAALTRAGMKAWRSTARGSPRGLFCGMGVCQDCLVSVDGTDQQRACMTKVSGAHRIHTKPTGEHPASAAPILADDLPELRPDLLVVGGGAGGLSAAAIAAEAGVRVMLIDERTQPGGQFYKQPADARGAVAGDRQVGEGRMLIRRARDAGVEFLAGAEAWGAFAPMTIGVTTPSRSMLVRPNQLIVATGAYERGLPVPGWTLPGVMTTGAAQTLLRTDGVVAGRRILVCGHGPFNLQVALELSRAGAGIVAVAELAARPSLQHAGAVWDMLHSAPDLVWQGMAMRRDLARRGVPMLHGDTLASVAREGDALLATLRSGERFVVDTVLMGYGFMPANELLLALGCRHDFDAERGHLATQRDTDCRTSAAGVYAVGDCCGLGGARAASEEGLIAGAAAAQALGHTPSKNAVIDAHTRLARHRRFQAGLWRLFAAPRFQSELALPDTIVCRCEEVTLGAIEAALAEDGPDIGEVKRRTRLGMGPCQGRYCAPTLAAMLAERQGRPLDAHAFFAPRAPVKPVAIKDLVRVAQP
jgi:D-hydroxyproline dehydrogenase subunit alpha